MTMTVLVTGGAGYIGAHACLALARKGYRPVVYDNLSNGHRSFVRFGPLEVGDVCDGPRLRAVMRQYRPAAILHFAGLIEVGQSVVDPASFYINNTVGSMTLAASALALGIDKLVFSSTCATYGEPETVPIGEDHRQRPINPYGRTKHAVEECLRDLGRHAGLRSVILRYFNAAGADAGGLIGEWHKPETHVIPLLIETALGQRPAFTLFGTDYDTPDGTAIRDYVHVSDLAEAHVRAVDYLLAGGPSVELNLGTGEGTSVGALVATARRITGRPIATLLAERRPGDAARLVADNAAARHVLGWLPRHDLDSMVASAFAWHRSLAIPVVQPAPARRPASGRIRIATRQPDTRPAFAPASAETAPLAGEAGPA